MYIIRGLLGSHEAVTDCKFNWGQSFIETLTGGALTSQAGTECQPYPHPMTCSSRTSSLQPMHPPPSVMEDTWALSTSTVCGLQKRRHLATKSSASWNLRQLSSLAECLALSSQAAGCFSTATTKLMWTW